MTEWIKATGIRALRTFAATLLSAITVGQAFAEISWLNVLSVSGVATVIAILTCIVDLPEVTGDTFLTKAKATAIRVAKTFCEMSISMVTVGQLFSEIDWLNVVSVSGVAALCTLLMSLKGLPEADDTKTYK